VISFWLFFFSEFFENPKSFRFWFCDKKGRAKRLCRFALPFLSQPAFFLALLKKRELGLTAFFLALLKKRELGLTAFF
jgi:hypothetical protein